MTGQKLFDGKSVVEVAAAISKHDPTWERVPDWMPSELQRLLRRCVHRDIGRRLQHIADTRLELLDALDELDQPRRDSTSGPLETRQVVKAVWTLSTEVCRHLNRENFDAAIIGDHVEFLDNQRSPIGWWCICRQSEWITRYSRTCSVARPIAELLSPRTGWSHLDPGESLFT